jgi:dipeptidyl aminopeptidase/acylaminoacyl peptidase
MNQQFDRAFVGWLYEGPETGSSEAMSRALDAVHRTRQRPGWAVFERWIPMELTMRTAGLPRPRLVVIIAALLAAAVATTILLAGATHRAAPPFGPAGNGKIVVDVNATLWTADADGANPRALGADAGRDSSATFSPDGTRLAFLSRGADGRSSVLVTRAEGGDAVNVTGSMRVVPGDALSRIGWAPDGSWLVFESMDAGVGRLFVVNADGTGLRQLPSGDKARRSPTVSPDGTWLAYQEQSTGGPATSSLGISRPDGSEAHNLVTVNLTDGSFLRAQWSADSGRLAYFRSEGNAHVVATVDLDGVETVVSKPGDDPFNPVWSPDATRLAYGASAGVVVVDVATQSRVTIPPQLAGCDVFWSPDGTALLGLGASCTELYRIPLDDPGAATRIAVPAGTISFATWQRIAP